MKNHHNSPNKRQGKNNGKSTQLITIFQYLQTHIATASMVANATGISKNSITRYKRDLEKQGLLSEVKRGYCELTNHLAWYLTTNKKHFPQSNQLKSFKL